MVSQKYKYIAARNQDEVYKDLRTPTTTESEFVQCNGYFTAIPWTSGGGGSLLITKKDDFRRIGSHDYMIKGHQGPITDF